MYSCFLLLSVNLCYLILCVILLVCITAVVNFKSDIPRGTKYMRTHKFISPQPIAFSLAYLFVINPQLQCHESDNDLTSFIKC